MQRAATVPEWKERSAFSSPALVLSLIVFVYLATMPTEYARGDAAVEHSLAAGGSLAEIVRSNHLLTSPLNRLVLQAVPAGDYRAGLIALELLQVLAAFLAGLALFRLARREAAGISASLWPLLLVFFLAFGVWRHAITIESGMVPLALLIASLWILEAGSGDRATVGRTALGFAVFSLGVLFALNQVLLAPALLALVALRRREDRAEHLLAAVDAMLLVGFVPYVVLAASVPGVRSPEGFFLWVTDHPDKESLAHLTIGLESVFRSVSGFLNLLVDLRGAPTFIRLLLSGGGAGSFDPALAGRLAAGAGLAGGLLVLAWIGSRGDRALAVSCWTATAATLLFGIYWLGSDPQFWLPAWPFVFLLAARGAARLERTRWRGAVLAAAWLAAAALPLLNLPVFGPSLLAPSGGPEDRTARELAPLFRPGDLLLYPSATHGDSWVSALHHRRGDVRIVSLADKRTFGEARAAGFRDGLTRWIDERRREDRQVFVDGLVGPVRPEQVGPWEVVQQFRGWNRSDLRKLLSERYDVRIVRTRSGEALAVIGEKRPAFVKP